MISYVAFLRGIGPGDPRMTNQKLRGVFESLGFQNVRTVISSGNVLFETESASVPKLEAVIEQELPKQLGFRSITIARSQKQLYELLDKDPFKGLEHGPASYLLVTFLKRPVKLKFALPYQPPNKPYQLIDATDNALFTVTDNTKFPTTDLMTWLEKQFGGNITSRTWNTVQKVSKKLGV